MSAAGRKFILAALLGSFRRLGKRISAQWAAVALVGVVLGGMLGAAPAQAALQPGAYAYVTNSLDDTVSVFNTATNAAVGSPIPVGDNPAGIAATPDGGRVYVANTADNSVSVISTTTNTVVATIPIAGNPFDLVITPDGSRVYVTRGFAGEVSIIRTATNTVVDPPITVGTTPQGITILPDGTKVYVVNSGSENVSVITTATNTATTVALPAGASPNSAEAVPDNSQVYVTNTGNNTVSVINTATDTLGAPVTGFTGPLDLAVTPDGTRLFVTNQNNSFSVITRPANTVAGPFPLGSAPGGVAVRPDGARAFITRPGASNVAVITTADNSVAPAGVAMGAGAARIAIVVIPALAVSTTSLPATRVGAAYSATLAATGGTTPFTWAVAGGALPAGLTLNASTGAISGTPTASGAFTVTVRVTDASGATAEQTLTLVVSPVTTVVIPTSGGLANTGQPVSDMARTGTTLLVIGVVALFLVRRRAAYLARHRLAYLGRRRMG